jgi:hemerythrin-like domain-containing protein
LDCSGASRTRSAAVLLNRRLVRSEAMKPVLDRRYLVRAASGLLLVASACGHVDGAHAEHNRPVEVTPPEDLMREHGVLNRVLLVYEAGIRKFTRGEDFDVAILSRAANIVREFIEGYHERNEEQQLFPRFRKAGQMIDLVDVLYQQHQAGRRLTDTILGLVPASQAPGENRNRLIASLQSFITMYRPHEAREDTDLFPKLRSIVSPHELDAMAEDFEREERRKFGDDGFESYVARVAALEETLGIHDLARLTPA